MEIQGKEDEVTTLLTAIEPNSLQALDIFACPQLHIPSVIQQFHHLATLKLISCRVTEWGSDAALTATHHSYMNYFVAIETKFPNDELPPGFLDWDFPPTLRTIFLRTTNVATLPDSLPEIWPRGLIFMLEFSGMNEFPLVVSKLSAILVSLAGNQIQHLPADIWYTPELYMLDLSGNPISALPDVPTGMFAARGVPGQWLVWMDVVTATHLTSIPSWLMERAQSMKFVATQTPVCDRILTNKLLPDEDYSAMKGIDCETWTPVGIQRPILPWRQK